MTTENLGLGFLFKNNGLPADFGIRVAQAGVTSGTTAIYATSLMGGNRTYSAEHGFVGATAVVVNNINQLTFPKTATTSSTNPYGQYTYSDLLSGVGFMDKRFRGMKAKIISGNGASDTAYYVIGTRNILFNPSLPTTAYSGLTLSYFYFDKPWTNGSPDSTSRFILYPFDDTDIGKVVMCPKATMATIGYNRNDSLLHSIQNVGTQGIFPVPPDHIGLMHVTSNSTTEFRLMNVLRWYGILYSIGNMNKNSGLMDNIITQDICDGIIHNMFGKDPFNFHFVADNSSTINNDINVSEASLPTAVLAPRLRDVASLNGFGGILRQIWKRTLPR
jgi:hypothetical protein